MSTLENKFTQRFGNQSLDVLTDDKMRDVLVTLTDESGSMTERALAAEIAAKQGDGEATPEEIQTVRTALYHALLPALDDAGLVSWDQSDETVAPTEHPLLDDARFEGLLREDGDDWDSVRSCVTDEDRRAVLDVLESRTGHVARTAIARELAARDAPGAPSEDAVHAVEVQLHHVHLPKLDDAGLVDYDADEETVAHEANVPSVVGDLLVGA